MRQPPPLPLAQLGAKRRIARLRGRIQNVVVLRQRRILRLEPRGAANCELDRGLRFGAVERLSGSRVWRQGERQDEYGQRNALRRESSLYLLRVDWNGTSRLPSCKLSNCS